MALVAALSLATPPTIDATEVGALAPKAEASPEWMPAAWVNIVIVSSCSTVAFVILSPPNVFPNKLSMSGEIVGSFKCYRTAFYPYIYALPRRSAYVIILNMFAIFYHF